MLLVPPGVFKTGSFNITSHTTLRLAGGIVSGIAPDSMASAHWDYPLLPWQHTGGSDAYVVAALCVIFVANKTRSIAPLYAAHCCCYSLAHHLNLCSHCEIRPVHVQQSLRVLCRAYAPSLSLSLTTHTHTQTHTHTHTRARARAPHEYSM